MRISDWSSDVCSSDLVVENKRRRGLGAQPHLGVLADVDDVVGENAVGATVHRHSDDVEATAVGERPQDRREYVACPAALRVEIEDAIALREIAKRHFLQIGKASVRTRVCQYG